MNFEIKKCKSFKERFFGMLFLKEKKPIGYYFYKCRAIHTFFMRFPIDIVLLDKENNILKIERNKKPWRIYFFKCYSVLEVPSGFLPFNIEDYLF